MNKTIMLIFLLIFFEFGILNAKQTPVARQVQYFEGQILTSSLDGEKVYGPSVSSLVQRIVDPAKDRIIEIVHQRGRAFVTILKR